MTAESWRGPYKLHAEIGPAPYHIEDPVLFADANGNFHALVHGGAQGGSNSDVGETIFRVSCTMVPSLTYCCAPCDTGFHAWSNDGKRWKFSQTTAYTTSITTADGVVHSHHRRERPHLLFGPHHQITHLYTSLWKTEDVDKTVTFVQEVNGN
jgi:hypothetical protein